VRPEDQMVPGAGHAVGAPRPSAPRRASAAADHHVQVDDRPVAELGAAGHVTGKGEGHVAERHRRAVVELERKAATLDRASEVQRLVLRQVRRLLTSPDLVVRTITAVQRENGAAETPLLDESEVIEALGALSSQCGTSSTRPSTRASCGY
jgi:hypothetical protein